MAHGVILGQSIPDLNNTYLALDGSNAMTGRLQANDGISIPSNTHVNSLRMYYSTNFGRYYISVPGNIWINSTNTTSGQINLGFNNSQKFLVENDEVSTFVPLNMGNNKITNVANGVADTDAATVGQLNAAVANNVAAVFGRNDENSGVVIGPTCLYVWKASTLVSTRMAFDSEYAIINKWYNLSGLYNKGINELDLLAPNGTNTTKIGSVSISDSSFSVYISTTYCGFAYFQTFTFRERS